MKSKQLQSAGSQSLEYPYNTIDSSGSLDSWVSQGQSPYVEKKDEFTLKL